MNTNIKPITMEKEFPNIFSYGGFNPTIESPSSPYSISFVQTKETLIDVDVYRNFLYSAITRVRSSAFYKHYKSHLISLGIDRCQLHPHIIASYDGEDAVANLELHHHVLTIFDIALLISEHTLNTYGSLSSYDLSELIKIEHKNHNVCTLFLCKTCHQLYHNNNDFKIPATLGFGKWWELLDKYKYGITRDMAIKIYYMLKNDLKNADDRDEKIQKMLTIRDQILNWAKYNERYLK